ncbi:MAG: hypothetical protein Cons2KO_05380 [Congregibacter sp.]
MLLAPSLQAQDISLEAEGSQIPEFVAAIEMQHPQNVSFADIWRSHRYLTIAALTAFTTSIALLIALLERNRRLRMLWKDLRQSIYMQKEDRQRLSDLNRHFELFLTHTTDFVYFKNAAGRYIFVSESMAKLVGANDRHELEGKTDEDIFPPDIADEYTRQEAELYASGEAQIDDRQSYLRSDGSMGWVSTYKWPVFSPDGERVLGAFGISRDVTELQEKENELKRAANHDPLTGLPNRNLFSDRLLQAMASVERRGNELAVVYMDLDKFKQANDLHGHAVGDALLKRFSELLSSQLRRSDTVARLGGDEFVLLLADLNSRRECLALLDRLMLALSRPQKIAGVTLDVTTSAGVAFFGPGMRSDPDTLLRQADEAMYQAKQAGRNRYKVISQQSDGEEELLLNQLKQSVQEQAFEIHYQPIVDLRSGVVLGAEALLRWDRDGRELWLPDQFLPLLAGKPEAVDLDQWVLVRSLEHHKMWRDNGLNLRLQINVTVADLGQVAFLSQLQDSLAVVPLGLAPQLSLEIDESAALAELKTVNRAIDVCAGLGVEFALDNFGTSVSTLENIRDLRVSAVKLGKEHVQSMTTSKDDHSLISALVLLARTFNRRVIAEGIETVSQAEMLIKLGCDVGQGHAIAKPMPPEQFLRWCQSWEPEASWKGQFAERRASDKTA